MSVGWLSLSAQQKYILLQLVDRKTLLFILTNTGHLLYNYKHFILYDISLLISGLQLKCSN